MTGLTQFNGTVVHYGYDDANRLTDLENLTAAAGTAIAAYHFTLDNNGNRVQSVQDVPALPAIDPAIAARMTYYNDQHRLYNYTNSHDSDPYSRRISFAYDNEGRLIRRNSDTYTFDYEHRLTGISGTVNNQFRYDGAGNRLEATRDGVVTRYAYDINGNLIAEADANNTITRYYIHGAGLMAMVTTGNDLYCYHFDATGHTVALTDADKQTVNSYAYSPFGALAGGTEAIPQPFKFVGQHGVMNEPNGLYYMRARYYDPRVGRFISEDPLGFDGGDVNLYAYVGNSPVMLVDPWGLCSESTWGNSFEESLNNIATYSSVAGTASRYILTPQGKVAQTVFYGIAAGATALKSFLFSAQPGRDAVQESVKMATPEIFPSSELITSPLIDSAYGLSDHLDRQNKR